jgi:hypothetical protein
MDSFADVFMAGLLFLALVGTILLPARPARPGAEEAGDDHAS